MNKKIISIVLLIISAVLLMNIVSAVPTGGVSYYDFEEGTSTTVGDSWGSNDGAATSMTWSTTVPSFGVKGNGGSYSGEFDGINDELDFSQDFSSINNAGAISIWLYNNDLTDTSQFALREATSGYWDIRVLNSGSIQMEAYDSSYKTYEETGLSDSTWYNFIFTWDSNDINFYVNGVLKSNQTFTGVSGGGGSGFTSGYYSSSYWDGLIDELKIFDDKITANQAKNIYDEGVITSSGLADGPSVHILAKDLYDNSTVNNFTVTLDNGSSYITTNGTVELNNVTIGNYTFNVTYNDHFNTTNMITVEAAANSTTYTETVYPYQSVITFASYELITNSSLTSPSYTTNGTSGSPIYPKAGTNYIVLSENAGYFNQTEIFNVSALDNLTIDVTGIYSSVLNISAQNAYTSNSITNFSGYVYHPGSGNNRSYTTTSGNYSMPMIPGNFSVYLEADGYSVSEDNYQNITINESAHNLSFSLYSNNSILIYIKDENTGSTITSNITITVTGANETQYNTVTGSYFLENLTDGNYSIKFSGDNYTIRTYTVTVAERSTQILTAYLVANSEEVIMSYLDEDSGATLEGISASMSRLIGGVWTVVQSKESDITGRIQFIYLPDVKYKFTATLAGYDEKTFYLDPVIFDSYNVKMSKETTITNAPSYQGVAITPLPSVYYNDQINNFSITFNSPDGVFSSYSYNITFPGGFYSGSGSNAYGGTFTKSLNITGAAFGDQVVLKYVFDTSIGSQKDYSQAYEIRDLTLDDGVFTDNQNKDYGLGIFERILITLIVTIIVTGILSLLGGVLLGAPIGLILMGYLTFIGFMPLWAALPSLLVGFIIIASRSS